MTHNNKAKLFPIISFSFLCFNSLYKRILSNKMQNYMIFLPIFIYFIIISSDINYLFKFIFLLLLFIFEISETICFYTTQNTFNYQFFSAINVHNFSTIFHEYKAKSAILILIIIIIIFYLNFNIYHFPISFKYIFFLHMICSLLIFKKYIVIKKEMFPFGTNSFKYDESYFRYKFSEYLNTRISVQQNSKPKNLIIIELESFELQNLGTYNQDYKDLMPYLSRLAASSTIFNNIEQQGLTGWSIASLFCTFCALPMIPLSKGIPQGIFHLINHFKCYPDFLKMLNYSLRYFVSIHWNIGNVYDFLQIHHFTSINTKKTHNQTKDYKMIDWIIQNELPNLKDKQPFVLFIATSDTHVGFYDSCPGAKKKVNNYFTAFECVDIFLEKLINGIKANNLYNNSEIIIYGDHRVMSNVHNFRPPRSLAIILPKKKYGRISKKISFYDFPQIVFHLLDIKIKPNFPFGNDPFSENYIFNVPQKDDCEQLYNLYRPYTNFSNSEQLLKFQRK